ncbi:MAG: hypothetical protein Q8N44_12300 [Rubrivivax sp.]|nr:hypothetical protein [Rubrivivax sp.]
MPIVDIEWVCQPDEQAVISARALADALGQALGSPAGRTWVRLHRLDAADYAENDSTPSAGQLPVFVTLLHSRLPAGSALLAEVSAITDTVARCLARPADRVHVQYAPAAAGRQAFGGRLVE